MTAVWFFYLFIGGMPVLTGPFQTEALCGAASMNVLKTGDATLTSSVCFQYTPTGGARKPAERS